MSLMLSAVAAAPICIGTRNDAAGWACRRQVAGHYVLDLHGTDEAIGNQYGQLLHDELITAYVPMVEGMLAELPGPFRAVLPAHQSHLPGFMTDEMHARARGLEAALSLPKGTVLRYAWLSELGSVGPALKVASARGSPGDALPARPTGGCTSFVARAGESTLHARNVDFWGMRYWQPHAALVFVEPLNAAGQPDGYRYAQVSELGEIFAGTTGLNERGLVVTTHLHVSRDVTLLNGDLQLGAVALLSRAMFGPRHQPQVSVLTVVERMLRRADTVEAAIALITELRTAGAWSFMLSDPGGGRAIVAMTQRDVAVTRDATVLTNLYPDPEMNARERTPARGPVEGARLRLERARALVAPHADTMDVPTAVAILRDRLDLATGEARIASANSVMSPDATQSIVFITSPRAEPILWFAVPHRDGVTPAPLAPYVSMRFSSGFDATLCPEGCVEGTLPYTPGPLDAGATMYAEAIARLVDDHDAAGAVALLRAVPGDDPGVHLMCAWLSASRADWLGAAADLQRAQRSPRRLSAHHQVLAAFLEGALARRRGDEPAATAAFLHARALVANDTGPHADLNLPMLGAIEAQLAQDRPSKQTFPVPDLKFQDVFGLAPTHAVLPRLP